MNLFDFYVPEWVFVAISFLILVFFLTKFLWKPVNKILDERQVQISEALAEAKSIAEERRQMDHHRAETEATLSRLTLEQMKEARVRAGKEYDRIVAEAEDNARAIMQSARAQAERERERLIRETKGELVLAALEAAGILIGARMDGEENERYIETVLYRKGGLS